MSSSHQFFNELSENMGELLETGANYDVEVQIGDDINAKKFRVHSVILAARCPYFRSVLSSKWTRKSGDVFIFKKTNISPETFKEILKEFCLQEICENPQIIFGSSDYLRFNKTLLSHILRRDDLVMEEIEIWMNILKWSLSQNSLNVTLNELHHLSDQEFIVLKETMKDLIPYIRWAYISPSDFLHLIHPFGRLLPGTLYEQVLSFYLDSGYRPRATIMVTKLSSSNQLIGGYNPLFWSSHYKIARVHQQKHAIYYNHKCGPGWGYSGDLIIKDSGSIYNSQNSTSYPDASKFFPYTKSAKYDKFYKYNIDDYEVFQIIKKPGCKSIC
ncbi:7241_t:CDS:2 [Diversispora eburnea]|uniref:7241_t:CDS:1 n=1 Tax=Diversispora eburnea TaxID=1213867 RepID=A0A9N8WKM5_9GLOM|nr:7241_t:CDS:2 [Diversispora eburnea]